VLESTVVFTAVFVVLVVFIVTAKLLCFLLGGPANTDCSICAYDQLGAINVQLALGQRLQMLGDNFVA
jgi:hypothetical protein